MPRYSRYETYGDGPDIYDDRCDASEFLTNGQGSRGPSSGTYSDGTPFGHSQPSRSSSSRRFVYDEYGYPIGGAHAGEEDLRRRMSRYQVGESASSRSDPRARLGQSDGNTGYESGRRSRLSNKVYADDREAQREARRDREQQQAELEDQVQRQQERDRRRAMREYGERSGRRGAVTSTNDEYLAYM